MTPQTAVIEMDDAEARKAEQMLREQMRGVVSRLETEAKRRVGRRKSTEDRWLEDYDQYSGRYDQETRRLLDSEKGKRSTLFINQTRPKTNSMIARLEDMLFPVDDRNWSIEPTPVPTLTKEAEAAVERAREARQQAMAQAQEAEETGDPAAAQAAQVGAIQAEQAENYASILQEQQAEARARAKAMEEEIADQLAEGNYSAECRDVIRDACIIGTGVMKAPVGNHKARGQWQETEQGFIYAPPGEMRPTPRYVDPWGFFPDPDARTVEESDGIFERHLMNEKELRRLARMPGFDADAIRTLLRTKPIDGTAPDYLQSLRDITQDDQGISTPLYHVWEYSGPLDAEDLRALEMASGREPSVTDEDVDPLEEINVVLWFCNGEILKLAPYPLDTGECLYSVFCLEKQEGTIWGIGIPRIIREQQRMLNSAIRALMDNMGLSAGPMWGVYERYLEPIDNDWTMRPRKGWRIKEGIPANVDPFVFWQVPSNASDLIAVLQLAEKQIDDVSSMPMIAQGEQGAGVTKTAQGMAILMNSTNVVFRRVVKGFDDDLTTPIIRRMFDWNMQTNDRADIKGDMQIVAKGSSTLLVREMQAQNFMMIAGSIAQSPLFGPLHKPDALLREMYRAQGIMPDKILKTEDEIAEEQAAAAAQEDPAVALEREKLELQRDQIDASVAIAQMKAEAEKESAQLRYDTEMARLAQMGNVKLDEADAKMAMKREELASRERGMAVEVAMAAQTGQHAGGAV